MSSNPPGMGEVPVLGSRIFIENRIWREISCPFSFTFQFLGTELVRNTVREYPYWVV